MVPRASYVVSLGFRLQGLGLKHPKLWVYTDSFQETMGGPGSPQPLILLLVGPVETLPLNPKHSPPLPLQRRAPTRHQSPIPFVRRAWGFGAMHGCSIRQILGIHAGIGYIHVCSKEVPVFPPWDPSNLHGPVG